MRKKSISKTNCLFYNVKIFCVIIITLVSFFTGSINSNALSYGFETIDLSEANKESIWDNINLTNYDDFDVEKNSLPIVSFDVSASDNIVLGLQNNKILIFDNNNDLLKCFEFTNDGTFYVKWNDENILLFMSRGTIVVEFSLDGSLVNMIETDTKSVNNNKLWNDVMDNTRVSINGYNYELKNDLGILNLFTFQSFSQLIRTDKSGASTVIYDVNQEQLVKIISSITLAVLIACVCLVMVRHRIIELRNKNH